MSSLSSWLNDKSKGRHLFFIKRLSANDTGATGSHQSGVYIPPEIMRIVIPSICHTMSLNPSTSLIATVSSEPPYRIELSAKYYNSKYFQGTVNEFRLTRWGGSTSPLMNTDNTGALVIFSFQNEGGVDCKNLDIWICRNSYQDEELQAIIGDVIPGRYLFGQANEVIGGFIENQKSSKKYNIPVSWHECFPTGRELMNFSCDESVTRFTHDADALLMERRRVEYDIFLYVEELHASKLIKYGFDSVDSFIKLANSISNRRKSRGGRSLELHLERILHEFGVSNFSTQVTTEDNKKPDFIFPSQYAYKDSFFSGSFLRMLAVKSTCKDRWRQVLTEANRIPTKHLFTLQEGVSINQFNEMKNAGIKLVVPRGLHNRYPVEIRGELMTLSDFISELKYLNY